MSGRRALAFSLIAPFLLVGLGLLGFGAEIVYLGPTLLILLPLLAGRYPGEDTFARAIALRSRHRARRTGPGPGPRPGRPRLLPRGGRLVGAALAGRGPPL
jgi:hypothetical protein